MIIDEIVNDEIKDTSYKKTYVVELASSPAVILYIDYYRYQNEPRDKFFNGRLFVNGYANFDIEISLPSFILESLVEAFLSIKKKIDEDRD